jgi:hypothetical protein
MQGQRGWRGVVSSGAREFAKESSVIDSRVTLAADRRERKEDQKCLF